MALNLNDYEKTPWEPKMPITKDRMDKLEEGVYVNREALQSLDNSVITIDNSITTINSGLEARPTTTQVQALVQQGAGQGAWARTEIITAMEGDTYTSLKNRFDTDENAIADIKATLGTKNVEGSDKPVDAFSSTNTVYNAINAVTVSAGLIIDEVRSARTDSIKNNTYDSLSLHLRNIDSNIDIMQSNIANINAAAGENTTIAGRFAQLDALREEVAAAHRAVETGAEPDTLAKRFSAIDTAINGILTDVNTVKNTYVPRELVRDNFTSEDTDLPLSANKGKELRDMIGGAYNSENTVASAINTAERNAKNHADTNKVDKANIYNALDYVPAQDATDDKVLDARQGKALKDTIDALNTSLDARLDAIELELNNARIELGTDEESGDPLMSTLDQRLDAMDATAAALRNEVQVIANELAMYDDNDAIQDTWTRVDKLSRDVEALAAELSMARNENGELIDAASRIDNLEYAISHVSSDEDSTVGLTQRITTLESDVDTAENNISDLDTRLDAIDGSTPGTLINRVSAAESAITSLQREPKSATVIEATLPETGDPNKDYLIGPNEDGKYFYYKWINNSWNLISGGGGSGEGNNSGFIYTENEYNDLTTKEENTDYYVSQADGYHHYRWVGENEIEIAEPVKRYNIALETVEDVNYLNFYEFNPGQSHIINDDTDLSTLIGNRTRHLLLPSTGGGGAVNTMKITQVTSRNVYNAYNSNLPIKIRFFFTTGEVGEGASYNFTVNGVTALNESVNITSGDPKNRAFSWPVDENEEELSPSAAAALGFYEFDVSQYCQNIDTYAIKLIVALDSNTAITAEANWNVQTINLNLVSNFTNNPTAVVGNQMAFTYIPTGNIEKIAHFILDGTEIGTSTIPARTNTTQTYNIPSHSAGAYKLEVYLTANNGAIKTSSIYRDLVWYEPNSNDIILASPYRGNTENVTQYDTLNIPYTVIGGNTSTYTVKYFVDDLENSINEVILSNTNNGLWTYQANLQEGSHTLMIQVGEESISFTLNVKSLDIDIAQVVDNLAIDFNPAGITNTSTRRLWTNGLYNLSVSDNFDWYNGGYGSDANGDYFLVKAGTRAIFDYKMFKSYTRELNGAMTTSSTVFRDGAEMKIIFKTSAVRNAEATWFTNMGPNNSTSAAKNVGIQLNVHNGWLRTDSADAANVKSYLYFPYSEEDRIELDININPETATNAVYCMSYEDGCPSRAYPYKVTEGLYQIAGNESNIIIGSDDCDVYIYRFKIYNTSLDTEEVLRNFIADGKDTTTCIERYNRNSIYYDTQLGEYTPYEGIDTVLDPERLAVKLPDVKILMLDAPIFTKSKKDFIKDSSLRCIHAPGGKVYPSRGKEDNWFFGNGYHAGQGTTSDKYGDAGRNVDFLFNCDGVHNPSDKVKDEAFVPGYKSYVIKGYGTDEQEEPEYCTDWKGDSGKISLTATSVPNNFFNMKVNIASSENVNNALFQKRYNNFLLYQSPAFLRDNRIKNDMEFVPAILFVRENKVDEQGNPDGHREFADTNWHFYALGNIGDSKKTDYTRAYDPTDINEFTLEISDNNTNNSQFQTGVYMKNGVRTIEPYTVVDDVDDDGKLTGTKSAKSSEEDITLETTAYLYPIDKETEWEAVDEQGKPKNMRYWGLMNEKFDGDHSFEMRYAYLGNYRDGKLVNGDKTTANAILERNSNVWRAFYTWLVTSSNPEIQNEFDQWCVRRSMAFFFAFTHYYTMIDNRAKNTFWHFAKTGKHRRVSRPVPELLHIYEVADGEVTESELESGVWIGTFKAPEDTSTITAGVTYYTQYAFDMWAYDMDTAAGIDNNGELIFPYGKEDTDDRVDGDPTSGKVFNGAGSVFWARLRDNFTSDITSAFTSADASCFNADNLIAEFDRVQNCYPEAIWRLDVERKYIRSFTGDDGSTEDHPEPIYLTRKNTRFLGDMMQGRKKYQRRQWIKDQGVYFGSKYKMLNVMDNQFDMVCYTIANQNVMANWDLTITPYQDMYINVEYAETPITPIRAKANVPVEIDCPFTSMNESRIRIYGADYIRALAGKPIKDEEGNIIGAESLASLYFRGNDFNHTNKLRELYIGSSDPTYNNSQFTTLNLNENSPILEVLDLQNCNGLSGTLDVSGCTSLKTVNVEGTSYSSVDLPSSTGIINLYLPETINRLVLTAAKNLTNLTMRARGSEVDSVDNLTEIIINDSDYSNNINWMAIAANALSHLTNLQLINLRLAAITNINEMEPFVERKGILGDFINANGENVSKINLTGLINVTGNWSVVEKSTYKTEWKQLDFNTIAQNEKVKCAVTYYHSPYINNSGEVPAEKITTIYVDSGTGIVPDIYANVSEDKLPTRDPTIASIFTFGYYNEDGYVPYSGWSFGSDSSAVSLADQGYSIDAPYQPPVGVTQINLYTYFYTTEHTYTVQWKVNNQIVKTVANQKYGGGYNLKAPTILELREQGIETATLNLNNDGTYTYQILEGWEKLPTNISPSLEEANTSIYVINAKWSEPETNTIDNFFADISNLSSKQLYILSRLGSSTIDSHDNTRNIIATSKFKYQMGYKGQNTNGIELIGDNNIKRLTSTTTRENYGADVIHPFSASTNDKGFTLVIDYQFGEAINSALPEVLVGCYDKDSTGNSISSFALYRGYNVNNGGSGTFVCYGATPYSSDSTKRRAIGDASRRNIIVLRREKGSPTLRIYTSANAEANLSLNTTISESLSISLATQNISEDAVICVGGLRNDLSTNTKFSNEANNVRNANGTIYWMKYWNEDLGLGECLQLASWPHEDITAIISAVNTATNRPKLYFTNLNCSGHSIITNNNFTTPTANSPGPVQTGYGSSATKTLCDTRIVNGLPIDLQAMIGHPNIGYKDYIAQYNSNGTQVSLSTLNSAAAYVYVPSVSSLDRNYTDTTSYGYESIYELTGDTRLNTSDITPYTWIRTASTVINAYQDVGSGEDRWNSITPEAYWLNMRFNEKPIIWSTSNKINIYITDSATIGSTTFYDAIGSARIKSGDIVIFKTATSGDYELYGAYMFVSLEEQRSKGIQTMPAEGYWDTRLNNTTRGGWIESTPYVTRSVSVSGTGRYPNYIYVDGQGALHFPNLSNDLAAAGSLRLDFAFTI